VISYPDAKEVGTTKGHRQAVACAIKVLISREWYEM